MPGTRYRYMARDVGGAVSVGVLDSATAAEVVAQLSRQGLFPVDIRPEPEAAAQDGARARCGRGGRAAHTSHAGIPGRLGRLGRPGWLRGPWRVRRAASFADIVRPLADLLSAGVPVVQALRVLSDARSDRETSARLQDLAARVSNGEELSKALKRAWGAGAVSTFALSMVRAGETGGDLAQTLQELSDFLDDRQRLLDYVRARLTYPMVVLCVGLLTIGVMLVWVLPRLEPVMMMTGASAKGLPGALLAGSRAVRSGWWAGALAVVGGAMIGVSTDRRGRLMGWARRRTPGLGPLLARLETHRALRMIGALLGRGVDVLDAWMVAGESVTDRALSAQLRDAQRDIRNGEPVSRALRERTRGIPPEALSMVRVGEERGRLSDGFLKAAAAWERQLRRDMDRLLALVEPALVVGLGVVVGGIAMAILLPIFEMSMSFQ